MKYKFSSSCYILISILLAFSSVVTLAQETPSIGLARLENVNGAFMGTVSFTQMQDSVMVFAQIIDLGEDSYRFDIQAVGACESTEGDSFVATDLADNVLTEHDTALLIDEAGVGQLTMVVDDFTVADLMDADGSAVIVHVIAETESVEGIACGIVKDAQKLWADDDTMLNIIQSLPIDSVPADVIQEEQTLHGSLVMTLGAMNGLNIITNITNGSSGVLGTMTREGDYLVITISDFTYLVDGLNLPSDLSTAPQQIQLDTNQSSTVEINLTTGEATRNSSWVISGTDTQYNGNPSLAVADTASTQLVDIQDLGDNRYSVRMVTHWRASLESTSLTLGSMMIPSGQIDSFAETTGVFIVDFNQ